MTECVARSIASLAIIAQADEVRRASAWLGQTGSQNGVPANQIGRLDLCLNETLANVISHGGGNAAAAPVWLRLEVNREQGLGEASVSVSNAGPAFDSANTPPKSKATTLAEAEPGGLGLTMIRGFSDALAYRYVDGRNELTFSVHWSEA